MKTYTTAFNAEFMVETIEEQQSHKIRLYDSNGNYFDYFEITTLEELARERGVTPQQWLDNYCHGLAMSDTIEEFCGNYQTSYTASENWEDLIEDLFPNEEDRDGITKEDVINNEYVNRFGNYYVVSEDLWR